MGAIFPVIGTAAQSAVSVEYRGLSTSLSQFFRSLGGAVGISILGVFMNLDLSKLQGKYLGKNELSTTLLSQSLNSDKMESSAIRHLFNHALSHVFLLACGFVLAGFISILFIGNSRLVNKDDEL
jgi:hypothetical protein